jgi:hypothetical protein
MTVRLHSAAVVADFLRDVLASGARGVNELEARARAVGLLGEGQQIQHAKTFKKAKKSLGIQSTRDGFGSIGKWSWQLPPRSIPPAIVSAHELEPIADRQSRPGPSAAPQDCLSAKLKGRRIPQQWVKGIACLDDNQPPTDVPLTRWRKFITDSLRFLTADENWAELAAKLGWDALSLFGCRQTRPLEYMASAGLVWAINGGALVQLHRDWALIERPGNRSQHVHHRRGMPAANVTLPWVGLSTTNYDGIRAP